MSYATADQLIDRLGTREAAAISRATNGVPDEAVLAEALALASEEVDAYVGRRYLLPLTSADTGAAALPTILQRVAIDIARYRQTGTEIMETETIRTRYKDAVKLLEQISRGEVSIGGMVLAASGGAAATSGSSAVRTGTKSFDMDQVL